LVTKKCSRETIRRWELASLIEGMTGAKLTSEYFSSNTSLEFFPRHTKPGRVNRVALVYGNNGSGKSTIAKGFREYRDSNDHRTVDLEMVTDPSFTSNRSGRTPGKIFIFDEEYIGSRVKVKNSGLDAIVLFGEQVALEANIEETQQLIKTEEKEICKLETDYSKFLDNSDVVSPDYWKDQISNKLREANGWASIGSRIKQQRKNLAVTDVEIERIGSISPEEPVKDLKKKFEKRYALFSETGTTFSPLTTSVARISIDHNISEVAKLLLEKTVHKPELTYREEQLLQLFGIAGAETARSYLSSEENKTCDKCFQPISEDYRTKALKEIESILNLENEETIGKLESLLIDEVSISMYEVYRKLPSYYSVLEHIEDYRKSVLSHNSIIKDKINNPFEKMEYDESIGLVSASLAANEALELLEEDRLDFNRMVQERLSVVKELLSMNDSLAHYDIETMFASMHKQRTAKETCEKLLKCSRDELAKLFDRMTQFDSQRKNIQIAIDEINKSLAYVFFSKERLSLEIGFDKAYHLIVNGSKVEPSKVSCGERNALALCYFFTEIARDMDAESIYADECLLVVDDPISSFDLENRIGILSFLRWKLARILEGCATSKILLMTHDIGAMFDLSKALQEISRHCSELKYNAEYCLFQLDNKELSEFKYKGHNEYTQLLLKTYQYAKGTNFDETDLIIGNVMRRVLEAFSSFSFKLGIDELSLNERVLGLLPDEHSREYYRNLMYRLVLNNESHFYENIQGAPETSFFSLLSSSEKQRTARDILCFIYHLNKEHVLSHMGCAQQDLEAWCSR